ncbi:glycerophosphodiester phosphodiesterase family protein [Aquimarina sediminis]|uniref:glycerophosphodiester phosphodiesterase family protein n=1 Tax=Aquimarina sediminis TaxID=2070536 RepID=UPI0019D4D989|nr:glycerophosphodiester phosphodiesterase family protein [Aquimarina sediminis]
MKSIVYLLLSLFLIGSCKKEAKKDVQPLKERLKNIEDLIIELDDSRSDKIMVIAHRGDWRNAPENSLRAIKNCIDMGVDMVELDVRKTQDNQLIVMHDATLDRTTTGHGKISETTLDSIKKLVLKNGLGSPTSHKVPTLKEALNLAKGKILINLDKCYDYFEDVYQVLKETNTENQVILKGFNKTVNEVQNDLGSKLDTIIFMPVINLDKETNATQVIEEYQDQINPVAVELVFSKENSKVLYDFDKIKQKGARIWVNSLWGSLNAGYEDDKATNDIEGIYGWYVKKGVNMIQTDRPELLLKYLRSKKLHN